MRWLHDTKARKYCLRIDSMGLRIELRAAPRLTIESAKSDMSGQSGPHWSCVSGRHWIGRAYDASVGSAWAPAIAAVKLPAEKTRRRGLLL